MKLTKTKYLIGYLVVTFLLFLVRLLFPSVTRTTTAADEVSPAVEVADELPVAAQPSPKVARPHRIRSVASYP